MVDDQLISLLLKPHEFEDGGWNLEDARNQVCPDFLNDLIRCLALGIAIVGDRRTGVSMDRLVSS